MNKRMYLLLSFIFLGFIIYAQDAMVIGSPEKKTNTITQEQADALIKIIEAQNSKTMNSSSNIMDSTSRDEQDLSDLLAEINKSQTKKSVNPASEMNGSDESKTTKGNSFSFDILPDISMNTAEKKAIPIIYIRANYSSKLGETLSATFVGSAKVSLPIEADGIETINNLYDTNGGTIEGTLNGGLTLNVYKVFVLEAKVGGGYSGLSYMDESQTNPKREYSNIAKIDGTLDLWIKVKETNRVYLGWSGNLSWDDNNLLDNPFSWKAVGMFQVKESVCLKVTYTPDYEDWTKGLQYGIIASIPVE
jgi:hypothetical protein